MIKALRYWCSGRDLNPGHGLERPVYLSGLYYRSYFILVFGSSKIFMVFSWSGLLYPYEPALLPVCGGLRLSALASKRFSDELSSLLGRRVRVALSSGVCFEGTVSALNPSDYSLWLSEARKDGEFYDRIFVSGKSIEYPVSYTHLTLPTILLV